MLLLAFCVFGPEDASGLAAVNAVSHAISLIPT
jgi:hypothetical protein